jgi:hypothetical protein
MAGVELEIELSADAHFASHARRVSPDFPELSD